MLFRSLDLYRVLKSINPVFVTTNYDRWLDEPVPKVLEASPPDASYQQSPNAPSERRALCCRPEHFTTDRLTERGAVIHLHGSYHDPNSMIISLRDYISHYANEHVRSFLRHMFKNYTVLFIGYGLAELEIIEYAIRADDTRAPKGSEGRHFILWPCLSSEDKQTTFMRDFFSRECRVNAVPYILDKRGHIALLDLLKSWITQIEINAPSLIDLQIRIDQFINEEESAPNREAAIRLLAKEQKLIPYFFNKVRNPVWFSELKEARLIDPNDIPAVEVTDSPGGGRQFNASDWPALRYLREIAENHPDSIPDQLAAVILAASKTAEEKGIDNWRVWWSLASILARLPLEVISIDHIVCVRHWICSRFDSAMVGHELATHLLPRLLQRADHNGPMLALQLTEELTALRSRSEGN